ncbi:MAG: type II CAAX prenyl endopeptidase Rce1 family protein [Allosphingosinicella sp.]|uniref:CPBP family glutamic-type intramembrane protease n=1 Tax=Allosphingosinicella sp. TaxID=2823234 RepID=UPI00393D14DF
MIEEARGTPSAPGLRFHDRLVDWLAKGQRPPDGDNAYDYVAPDPAAPLHRSLKGAWWLLEAFPQRTSEREWPKRLGLLGFYLPWAEPRPIPNRPWRGQPANEPFAVHRSVFDRVAARPDYRPVNIPGKVVLEPPGPMPPSAPRPPYRPEGLWARLKRLFVTVPSAAGWLAVGKSLLWLAPLLALLGWWGGFLGWDPRFDGAMLTIALIAFVLPALAEETLFRGILLKPPSVGVTGLGPAVLSAVLFALWHPLQLWVYRAGGFPEPDWAAYGGHWTFLLAAAAVGFACARLTLASRSLWPAVLLHWLVVVAWAALFGGPGGA